MFEAYLSWPPAWGGVAAILDAAQPWTPLFCEHALGDPQYDLVALVETDHNVPRHAFAGGATPIEAIDPQVRKTPSWPRSWANFSIL